MRIKLLDKVLNEWQGRWILLWFLFGSLALLAGFWFTTEKTTFDLFMLVVALFGLLCVVALAFRRNLAGNGLGLAVNLGEVAVQGRMGATGLVLAPLFYFLTHMYGLLSWRKHEDNQGRMRPRAANTSVWFMTATFILCGLMMFPWVNSQLQSYALVDMSADIALTVSQVSVSWYQVNIVAFVLGVTAQTAMILRYSFSWVLWIGVNFVWLSVNLANQNYIFAIQTMVYQVNAILGLYAWLQSSESSS